MKTCRSTRQKLSWKCTLYCLPANRFYTISRSCASCYIRMVKGPKGHRNGLIVKANYMRIFLCLDLFQGELATLEMVYVKITFHKVSSCYYDSGIRHVFERAVYSVLSARQVHGEHFHNAQTVVPSLPRNLAGQASNPIKNSSSY